MEDGFHEVARVDRGLYDLTVSTNINQGPYAQTTEWVSYSAPEPELYEETGFACTEVPAIHTIMASRETGEVLIDKKEPIASGSNLQTVIACSHDVMSLYPAAREKDERFPKYQRLDPSTIEDPEANGWQLDYTWCRYAFLKFNGRTKTGRAPKNPVSAKFCLRSTKGTSEFRGEVFFNSKGTVNRADLWLTSGNKDFKFRCERWKSDDLKVTQVGHQLGVTKPYEVVFDAKKQHPKHMAHN